MELGSSTSPPRDVPGADTGQLVCATLIGDIVASRKYPDRVALQARIEESLELVNGWVSALQPLRATVGDEFQGTFATISECTRASLLVRLQLLSYEQPADCRCGLGQGEITIFGADAAQATQDGPGWWGARAAIDHAHALADKPRTAFARTWLSGWEPTPDEQRSLAPVNSFLLCRDALIDQMSPRQRRLLLGLMLGQRQAQLAAQEGVDPTAVSQSLRSSGAYAILEGHNALAQAPA